MDGEQRREVLIRADEIATQIRQLALEIAKTTRETDGQNENTAFENCIVLLCVLDSAFVFASALRAQLQKLGVFSEMAFVDISSYGAGTESNGNPRIEFKGGALDKIKNRRVWVVEDMIDSGNTLKFLIELLQSLDLTSLNVVVLLQKIRESCDIGLEALVGFLIPYLWVDGYGIDTNEMNRELVDIWAVLLNIDNERLWSEFRKQIEEMAVPVTSLD